MTPPVAADPSDLLAGLSPEQRTMTAEAFFAAFPWEPRRLDPEVLTAEEFLAML